MSAQKKGAHMPGQKGRAFGPESPRAEPRSCRRATCKAAPAAPQGLKARLPGIYERTFRHALWPVLSEVRRSDTQALVWKRTDPWDHVGIRVGLISVRQREAWEVTAAAQ